MEFDHSKPIYLQIADWIADKILREQWRAEERIPAVREVAAMLHVNPNTAMRAYDSLQTDGIIYNKRGIGYFVSPDGRGKILEQERAAFLEKTLPDMFARMESLGLDTKDVINEYQRYKTEKR